MTGADHSRDMAITVALVLALTALAVSLVTTAMVVGYVLVTDQPAGPVLGRLVAGLLGLF